MNTNFISSKTNQIIKEELEFLSNTTRVPYYPLVVDYARGSKVIDVDGKEYIDFLSSAAVVNTGHNHPKVVESIQNQINRFIHYTPAYMYHEPHLELAKKLIEITPGDFPKKVAFGLSGSSSVDGAIKAAKAYTGKNKIISCLRSYHGTTIGALSVSGYSPKMHSKVGTLMNDVYFIPFPDSYRGFQGSNCNNEDYCLYQLENLFETIIPSDDVAAIIIEIIQGDAGILIPSKYYINNLQELCNKFGILLIVDEIQTGFGRTGKLFACEHYDLEPDILVLGKAIASGLPLSAIVARKEIMESWETPLHFFNTAGNPLSCSAALATIEIINNSNFLDEVNIKGQLIVDEFLKMKKEFDFIGDIRGKGLLIGVDIVTDKETKTRDTLTTAKICWRCWEKGLILAFFSNSVLRIAPPLTITEKEVYEALEIIKSAMKDVQDGIVLEENLFAMKGL